MDRVPSKSVDLILCDPPYGVTSHKWDKIIDPWALFKHFRRIIKDHGTILVFGVEPFASVARVDNKDLYKYDWIWKKSRKHGYVHAKSMPTQETELVSVYSPAFLTSTSKNKIIFNPVQTLERYRQELGRKYYERMRYDTNILSYPNVPLTQLFHSSQKPVGLLQYLIERHTNPGMMVLDPCCGSGSTLIAARECGRDAIGIEVLPEYVDVTMRRLDSTEPLTKRCWKKKSIIPPNEFTISDPKFDKKFQPQPENEIDIAV